MAMKLMKAFISLEEGMRILLDCVTPIIQTERVGLLKATGRVLAEPVVASMAVPPFPRAAMDGYAVIAEDTFGAGNFNPVRLTLSQVIHAGDAARGQVARGRCIQVATGSPIPPGADAVVQVEDTELEGDPARGREGENLQAGVSSPERLPAGRGHPGRPGGLAIWYAP